MEVTIQEKQDAHATDNTVGEVGDEKQKPSEQRKKPEPHRARLEKKELPKKKKDELARLKGVIANLTDELEKRETELVAANEKALRAVADYENYKKRLARESREQSRYASVAFISAVLPTLDHLDQACDCSGDTAHDPKTIREGMELTRRQFISALEKLGLEKLDVVGKPFDPESSEALQVEQTCDYEDGIVIREFAPGYRFKDKVIRRPKVVVAKNDSQNQSDIA